MPWLVKNFGRQEVHHFGNGILLYEECPQKRPLNVHRLRNYSPRKDGFRGRSRSRFFGSHLTNVQKRNPPPLERGGQKQKSRLLLGLIGRVSRLLARRLLRRGLLLRLLNLLLLLLFLLLLLLLPTAANQQANSWHPLPFPQGFRQDPAPLPMFHLRAALLPLNPNSYGEDV